MSEHVASAIEESLAGAVKYASAARVTLPPDHPVLMGNGLTSGVSLRFCQYWPIARTVILELQHFLPTWTAWIINILLAVGDETCKAT